MRLEYRTFYVAETWMGCDFNNEKSGVISGFVFLS